MTTADLIRDYVISYYIDTARTTEHEEVRIRLGNIRQEMGLTNPLQSEGYHHISCENAR